MKIEGRVALVTGASGGIGAATALALARAGASLVVLVARTESALEAVAERVEAAGGRARVAPCDLSDPTAIGELASALEAEAIQPQILVNNAGAGRWLAVDETPPEELLPMMQAPALAAFWVTRAFLPSMLSAGHGHILCVNSPAALVNFPGATGYSMSRWALRGFTEGLRADVAGTGVEVCHFVVGKVSSPYFDNNPGSEDRVPALSKLIGTLTPEQTADRIVASIRGGRRWVYTPLMLRLFHIQNHFFPWSVRWMLYASGWKRS
ncbi:MAG: SDR family NAD(P)-dependent oxidoreductase [Deltaproteobacteria bacterium]|nr:MAG: SDR family NAD(P)-dependent oxidoreductase [Deltaproteobacteria bacterium]